MQDSQTPIAATPKAATPESAMPEPRPANAPPKISVLMTVYNGMPFLHAAVQSILGQSYSDFEFVIVDDGSTDQTAEYLAKLSDKRIRILTQPNTGTAAAANAGLELCSASLLARMDADDVSHPGRFLSQLEFLEANPHIGILGSFTSFVGDSRKGGLVALPTAHAEIVAALREGHHALSHPSLMMRTELLRGIGGYWQYPLIDDWDMMLRMTEVTQAANLADPLLGYRVHRGSLNGSNMKRMRFSIDFARARATARLQGQAEPTLEEFELARKAHSTLKRAKESAVCLGLSSYRLGVAEQYGPTPLKALPRFAVAGAALPSWAFKRAIRQMRST